MTLPTKVSEVAAIDLFHACQLMYALRLEVRNPGLKMSRGSIMQQVNREYKTTFRKKADALKFMEEIVAEGERRVKAERGY